MKVIVTGMLLGMLSTSMLQAQKPTWAEELHKRKTGIYPAGVEKRLQAEKDAHAKQAAVQPADLFAALDHNRDGVISSEEWKVATQTSATSPGNNQ